MIERIEIKIEDFQKVRTGKYSVKLLWIVSHDSYEREEGSGVFLYHEVLSSVCKSWLFELNGAFFIINPSCFNSFIRRLFLN